MRGATETVTVWNRWRNPSINVDEWFRKVIPHCAWEEKIVTSVSGTGAVAGNVYSVLIDRHPLYMPRREWAALGHADKGIYFTLAAGEIMARGVVDFEITGAASKTEAAAKTAYAPDVFTISTVSDETEPYKRGAHYEVTGV